ncbi:hypothetical protein [Pseudooceanicola sp.]|uniref:hypothetical protein n=1 Tax=Pseudooceanicola sp. TaxID=1914328 RepID=UPI004057E369
MSANKKNWRAPKPDALPPNWAAVDLNFVPFAREFETGWFAFSNFGMNYEIHEREQKAAEFVLYVGVGNAVQTVRYFTSLDQAVEAAQDNFAKHLLGAFRLKD